MTTAGGSTTTANIPPSKEDLKSLHILAQWSRQVLEDFGESSFCSSSGSNSFEKLKSPRTMKTLLNDLKILGQRREEVRKRIERNFSRLEAMEDALQIKSDCKIKNFKKEIQHSGKFTLFYQEKLLEEKLVTLEKLAAMRLKKRIQTQRQAKMFLLQIESEINNENDQQENEKREKKKKKRPFLTEYQVKACAQWKEELEEKDDFFRQHILALLRNGWISLSEKELEEDQKEIEKIQKEFNQLSEQEEEEQQEEE
jgi:hypothetical protein